MLASNLRYTIQVYTHTTAPDTSGQPVKTEVLFKTKRAGKKYISGSESVQAEAQTATVKVRFQIRYDNSITESMTVKHDGESYDINYIEKIGKSSMFLHCQRLNK